MKRVRRSHPRPRWLPSPAMGVALVALCAAVGGVAMATVPDGSGVIHGCYDNGTGALRVTDTEAGVPRACSSSSETALPWVQTGAQGPPGQKGPQGPAGPAGVSTAYTTSWSSSKDKYIPLDKKMTTIALLDLPAGTYFVIAKAHVVLEDVEDATPLNDNDYYADPEARINCELTGSDPDAADLYTDSFVISKAAIWLETANHETMTLTGTPEVAAPVGQATQVRLRCKRTGNALAEGLSDAKLTALHVGNVIRQPPLGLPTVKLKRKVVVRLRTKHEGQQPKRFVVRR